ncbi:hypothetical protein ACQ1Q5_00035 [Ornithobacterium rhinotracheale]
MTDQDKQLEELLNKGSKKDNFSEVISKQDKKSKPRAQVAIVEDSAAAVESSFIEKKTVNISSEIATKLKIYSAQTGTPMYKLVEDALKSTYKEIF